MCDELNCYGCGKKLNEDEAIHATENGILSTGYGDPYCDECLPEEPEKVCKACGKPWQDGEDDLNAVTVRFAHGTTFVGFACKGCGKNPVTGEEVQY